MQCWMLVRRSSFSHSVATMSILRDAIMHCSDGFPVSIRFPRRVAARSMPLTLALTSPDQARALSIASHFSLEFFIRKNFRSLLLVGPRTRALLASKRNRLKPSEHVIGFREGLKRYVFAHSEEFSLTSRARLDSCAQHQLPRGISIPKFDNCGSVTV